MVFRQANVLFVFLYAFDPARVCRVLWLVCFSLWMCVFRDTPSPKLGMQVFFFFCVSLLQSLAHFPSLALFFPLLLPLLMSACFLLLLLSSPSLSPPTGAVCIPARRGGGVCDPGSIRTRPPLRAALPRVHPRPHPLPGKMGATSSLAGHRLPFWVCCQPWQQRLNMICLSAAACLHQTLAPTPITPARDPEAWLVGTDLERGSWRRGLQG